MKKLLLTICFFLLVSVTFYNSYAQLAQGKSKFLGNIIASSTPSNFNTYWNQVTPENGSKWATVEGTRDVMSWGQFDNAYNYAVSRGYNFKMHTLIWGAQYPGWMDNLSQSEQRAEIEEWMQAVAQRYPNIWAIDVVNEPTKTALPWKNALGGNGSTGWDWVITSFQLARQYFPGKKLLINEYGTENDANARNTYKTIINLLKSRGLIDGIGVQAHFFNLDNMSASQMTTCLNDYQSLGLDVYISELDIKGGGTEQGQSAKYQELFPVMWNHSSVKGITLWGYIEGQTWSSGTGILRSNNTEKPAMTWLKSFMASSCTPTAITPYIQINNGTWQQTSSASVSVGAAVKFGPQPVSGGSWSWSGPNGFSASTREVTISNIQTNQAGTYTARYTNSCGAQSTQAFNVAVGGGGSNTLIVRARGTNGSESIQLRVNNSTIATWTLTTSMANYTAATSSTGAIQVQFTNDATGRDVQVDYIQVNGTTRQAENQATNTGVWNGSGCGGSNSEWLHCNGYIAFGNVPKEAAEFEEEIQPIPSSFALLQNFPNPFNPSTKIKYELKEDSFVKLVIYDLVGREIQMLVNSPNSAGYHSVVFNSEGLPSGVYFYTLQANGHAFSKKMILMK